MKLRNQMAMAGLAMLMSACGGGGSTNPDPPPRLQVQLVSGGTYISCENIKSVTFQLLRTAAGVKSTTNILCPSSKVLSGDYSLSQWELQTEQHTVATAQTSLPAPTLLSDGDRWIVLQSTALAQAKLPGLELQLIGADGTPSMALAAPDEVLMSSVASQSVATSRWRWKATSGNVDHVSSAVSVRSIAENDLGYWGALAVGDTSGDARSELLGMTTTDSGAIYAGYSALGLDSLFASRDFRDVRVADLNNDGRDDVVGNVYGTGCLLIGIRRVDAGYDFHEPHRSDGSCISGHGETLLVADFDGDGLLDIVSPSYERFDYLKNLGNGEFEEIADSLGISFPNYLPHVEGATAVDLNLDGAVDIVIANEVLVNDGTGHFTAMPTPFGGTRIADEGQSVFDLDGDGVYDIVKNHPSRGLRLYWGQSDRLHFSDAGWQFGGEPVMNSSYGLAVGYYSGHDLPDVIYAGGNPAGLPPRICVQPQPRKLNCVDKVFAAHEGAFQDLLMLTDLDGDGSSELVARYGTIRTYSAATAPAKVFRIDLRDKSGLRNQYGHSMQARCTADNSLLGLRFVDGGNGYMAQSDYIVSFGSSWCSSIWLDVATTHGTERFGPLQPGTHRLTM